MLDSLFRQEAVNSYLERWLGELAQPLTGLERFVTRIFRTRRVARVPVLLQEEASECGLACLAMILQAFGRGWDVRALREMSSFSSRGITLRRIIDTASRAGLLCRPLRVELEYVPELTLPCLLHWGLSHYVVLVEIRNEKYLINDPATGQHVVGQREFSRLFTGIAVEFEEGADLKSVAASKTLSWRGFFGILSGSHKSLAMIFSVALFLEVLQILAPLHLQITVDRVFAKNEVPLRNLLAVAFLMIVLVQGFVAMVRSYALLNFGGKVYLSWFKSLFEHILKLPLTFFERRYASDLMGRFEGISYIQRSLASNFLGSFLDGLMSLGFLGMMFFYNARLASATLLTVSCAAAIRSCLIKPLRQTLREYENAHALQQGHLLESVKAVESIKQFCAEGLRVARWTNLVERGYAKHLRSERIQIFLQASNSWLFGCERVFVIWYASGLVLRHAMTAGIFFSYVVYRELLVGRLCGLLDRYVEANSAQIHLDRLADIVFAQPEPTASQSIVSITATNGQRLELHDLWFRYSDDDPWILKGVSAVIEGNETVAITGRSGCGKSTLLKLLQGLVRPTTGYIKFNGVDLTHVAPDYRRIVSAVNQSDDLFIGTIAENISFFDAPTDLERVRVAAQQAFIASDIESMPMQYNTLITDGGVSLSGGQKQRILLSRALYKEARVFFLDEATSQLDTTTELSVLRTLKQIPALRVLVAHRPETIAACGRVLRMEGGSLC